MGWMAASSGGAVAAAAAAAKRRRQQQEEEEMTNYTPEELDEDWEFKIVRAGGESPLFRKPENLRRLLEEEARAGWVMLEKLDDSRIRFKRHRSARQQDAFLPPDVDPYRTHYRGMAGPQAVILLVLVGLLVLGVLTFVILLAR